MGVLIDNLSSNLLVASPSLECPFFKASLVLVVNHGNEGSFGFALNKPTEISLKHLLSQLQLKSSPMLDPQSQVMLGGPVGQDAVWVLYDGKDFEERFEGTLDISERLKMTASVKMIRAIARGRGPSKYKVLLGYSGWEPGQLEQEFQEGSWFPTELDLPLLFDTHHKKQWKTALNSMGIVSEFSVMDAVHD